MSEQLRALISKAETSLRAANLLAAAGMFEFAGSRAYYTMFYLTEALLLAKGLTFSSHSAVIAAFGQHFVKTKLFPPHLHRYLMEGFGLRQAGDYGTQPISRETAERTIRWATEFLAAANSYLGPDQDQ